MQKEHAIACPWCAKYAYGCNVSANSHAVIREFLAQRIDGKGEGLKLAGIVFRVLDAWYT